MKYALENEAEIQRLEKQSQYRAYQLSRELAHLPRTQGRVLDAGCGTGLAARQLAQLFPNVQIDACDGSELRLAEARKTSPEKILYFQSDLERIAAPDQTYDAIICRYVFEHLLNPLAVARELHRVVKTGGFLYVINFDGVFYNLFHNNSELAPLLKKLETSLEYDLFIGRKVPSLLTQAGFSSVHWQVEAEGFQGLELDNEIELTTQRMHFAFSVLAKSLGSDEVARRFVQLYLQEMKRPGNLLFYNKFMVTGFRD